MRSITERPLSERVDLEYNADDKASSTRESDGGGILSGGGQRRHKTRTLKTLKTVFVEELQLWCCL